MRKFFSALSERFRQGLIGGLVGLGLGSFLIGPAALALVIPGQFAPRQFPTQQVHYERHVITLAAGSTANTTVATADGQTACITPASTTSAACSIRIGALPYNAFVVRGYVQVPTACNTGGTTPTCTISLGTASGGAQLVSAQSVATGIAGTAMTIVAANLGIAATGNGITSSGANGGFDLWFTLTEGAASGMTEATAGTIIVIVEYFAGNDGGCVVNVPIASSAAAC